MTVIKQVAAERNDFVRMFGIKLFLCFGLLSSCVAQLSQVALQQCAADLACSINYSALFQTKLDNATNYIDLQVAILRHQLDGKVQPLEVKVNTLVFNTTAQIDTIFRHLRSVEGEIVYDREYLGNLTRGLYILNDEYHKEAIVRYQDVHKLVLELTQTKTSLSQLQDAVNQLLTKNNLQTVQVLPTATTTPVGQTCAAKDQEISVLQANLTYYQNAYTTSSKAVDNLRQLQTFLQTQVYQLKQNITSLETASGLKDRLIVQLQQQLRPGQTSGSIGSCDSPLGMRDNTIPDSAITSSESQSGYEPSNARLDNGQGWYTTEKQNTTDYLQIDLGHSVYITKIATQGAPCCDVMVTNYTLQYSKDGVTWKEYQNDCRKTYFSGNTDSSTVVYHQLDQPIKAQYVRFNILDFKRDGVSNYVGMRAELYGCSAN